MKTVFLDLDGTLTDPAQGITSAINFALVEMGHAPLDPATMGWVIGPPLVDTFARLGVSNPELAVAHYRTQYTETGLFENLPYPGILEALSRMRNNGLRLVLMTAKPHLYAKRITAHFGIAPFLHAEYGPELDGTRNNKWELLAHALNELGADPRYALMVGDRQHDFEAAARNRMASLAVGWGFGTPSELALATSRCDHVSALPEMVCNLLKQNPGTGAVSASQD